MAEEKERVTPKSRIETLSDLIFGLATRAHNYERFLSSLIDLTISSVDVSIGFFA